MEENRTLLIVDDEAETLKGYASFLNPKEAVVPRKSSRRLYGTGSQDVIVQEGYRVLLASSGEEAVQLFKDEAKAGKRIAAGFFDVKLGSGMDGLATIHAIKSMDKDIHCVVVTAYQDRSVEEINQLFGEDFKDQWDYLNKPFTQGEIVQKARQMVSAWNKRRQIEYLHGQLIRTERLAAVGQVARGIGHEFGNILLRIMGKIDLSLLEKDQKKVQEHLQVAMKAAERAAVIVRNLQSFSKTEPNFQHESLQRPMDEALTLISHELTKASVQVEKQYQEVPAVRQDVGAMAQVFLNLLINAIHAMPQGGKIKIELKPSPSPDGKSGVGISIQDSGTGIAPEVLPRIFDYAFSTKGDSGSGLGLSVSKEIIESQGGMIQVQTQVGQGTCFQIWLPIDGTEHGK